MKSIFGGDSDCFKGLWIYDQIDWVSYPVVHIDMSTVSYSKTADEFEMSLTRTLSRIAVDRGATNIELANPKETFVELVRQLHKDAGAVVVLVDEYDKPIIDHIDTPRKAAENRDILRDFYAVLKGCDRYLKFAFFTGVSKFSKVSVFSGLNNLLDITVDDRFANIVGINRISSTQSNSNWEHWRKRSLKSEDADITRNG